MKIEDRKTSELIPYKNNTKVHTREQITAVANSIKQFGFRQPIVVDVNGVIVIGHCRYLAAKELHLETVPVLVAELDESSANALRIVDNKTNESDWDIDLLNEEIRNLAEKIDLTQIGFSIADIIMSDDNYEPEELDFDGEEEYIENADSQLKARQISISYRTEEEAEWLKSKLETDQLKVVFYARNIKK